MDRRIAALTAEFVIQARNDEAACRLTTIPGFGALNATALVAAIGAGQMFQSSRDLTAWLGLTSRQATTGGKPRLLGITKRGNFYLRALLIHEARAALPSLSASSTALGEWPRGLIGRAHKNKVVVALAGELARIAWAILRSGESYAQRLADRRRPERDRSTGRSGSAIEDVCGRWKRDGLAVEPAFCDPGAKNGARLRVFYEDQYARSSISAGARSRDRIRWRRPIRSS
jgi:Transposase IS116/IS110/IS902 family